MKPVSYFSVPYTSHVTKTPYNSLAKREVQPELPWSFLCQVKIKSPRQVFFPLRFGTVAHTCNTIAGRLRPGIA